MPMPLKKSPQTEPQSAALPSPGGVTPSADIAFGPNLLHEDAAALQREWLVTNGLGAYASATLAGANTRRYHGLLVAALDPPLGRAVLLSKLEEKITITGEEGAQTVSSLSANLYPGVLYPTGHRLLASWNSLPSPTWVWELADGARLEKRIWMEHGRNTTCIAYRLLDAPPAFKVSLTLLPLIAWKDYHSEMLRCDTRPAVVWMPPENNSTENIAGKKYESSADEQKLPPGTLELILPPIRNVTRQPTALRIHVIDENGIPSPGATFLDAPDWYYRFQHPREQERGLDFQEDLYSPGSFTIPLEAGCAVVVVATTEQNITGQGQSGEIQFGLEGDTGLAASDSVTPPVPTTLAVQTSLFTPLASWNEVVDRQRKLLQLAKTDRADSFSQLLTLAADQFLVQVPGGRTTVIAGYPWFCDWGRDTMIALPGLCLSTGRPELAREILQSFAGYVSRGMLPNRFPDVGAEPEYNTVDAVLWYFVAVYRYIEATGDIDLLRNLLWTVLTGIIDSHIAGTRYNIHVDPADGLLYAGHNGVQLTWMDAKVGDWVVTPRIGKPVEVNALWINALRTMAHWAGMLGEAEAVTTYTSLTERAEASFISRFVRPDGSGLYDVLDCPADPNNGVGLIDDDSVRPNQLFALSLPFAPIAPTLPIAQAILSIVGTQLWTPLGLRSLAPSNPAYRPRYQGDQWSRDGAYHQGTTWLWLTGAYAEAVFKVTGDPENARTPLASLAAQLTTYGIGSLAEIADGSEPQRPNGCFAQAWSVGETLRVWKMLSAQEDEARSIRS